MRSHRYSHGGVTNNNLLKTTYSISKFILKQTVTTVLMMILMILSTNVNGDLSVNQTKVFIIGVILPYDNKHPIGHMWSVQKVRPAIEYALEHIRYHRCILPKSDYLNSNSTKLEEQQQRQFQSSPQTCEVQVTFADSRCSETYGPLAAIDMVIRNRPSMFLGPACDYAVSTVARFSPHWGIPLMTAGAQLLAFGDKNQFSTTTRMHGTFSKLGEFVVTLFRQFGWNVTGMLFKDYLTSNKNVGRSQYRFISEAVYIELTKAFKEHKPDVEIFYRIFDENELPIGSFNTTKLLLEVSLVSRSKFYYYAVCTLKTIIRI